MGLSCIDSWDAGRVSTDVCRQCAAAHNCFIRDFLGKGARGRAPLWHLAGVQGLVSWLSVLLNGMGGGFGVRLTVGGLVTPPGCAAAHSVLCNVLVHLWCLMRAAARGRRMRCALSGARGHAHSKAWAGIGRAAARPSAMWAVGRLAVCVGGDARGRAH